MRAPKPAPSGRWYCPSLANRHRHHLVEVAGDLFRCCLCGSPVTLNTAPHEFTEAEGRHNLFQKMPFNGPLVRGQGRPTLDMIHSG